MCSFKGLWRHVAVIFRLLSNRRLVKYWWTIGVLLTDVSTSKLITDNPIRVGFKRVSLKVTLQNAPVFSCRRRKAWGVLPNNVPYFLVVPLELILLCKLSYQQTNLLRLETCNLLGWPKTVKFHEQLQTYGWFESPTMGSQNPSISKWFNERYFQSGRPFDRSPVIREVDLPEAFLYDKYIANTIAFFSELVPW